MQHDVASELPHAWYNISLSEACTYSILSASSVMSESVRQGGRTSHCHISWSFLVTTDVSECVQLEAYLMTCYIDRQDSPAHTTHISGHAWQLSQRPQVASLTGEHVVVLDDK